MLSAAVAALACLCVVRASPADPPAHHPHHTAPKDLSSILASIEERLRTLDAVGLAQARQARRLDVIQDKIERLESTLSLRLERAQLAAERLEHRLHMMQASMQSAMDATSARLERSQARVTAVALNLTRNLEPHRHLLDKVNGAYGEAWRRSLVLEALTRDGLSLVNVTRRELADGLRALARRQRDSRLTPADLDDALSGASATLARRLTNTTHKLEKKIQSVLDAQEHFVDTCQRVQLDDPRHVADVLDKLLDSLINKTATTFHELQAIQAKVRDHDARVMRTLASRSTQQSDTMFRRLESALRNSSHSPFKESELQQLTEKFVELTNRADAALQRLEARLSDEVPAPEKSEVTAAADRLLDKLNGIRGEDETEEDDDWADAVDYYDDGGGGDDIAEEDKDILAGTDGRDEEFETIKKKPTTARPPHRRHLHKHPYDRGPGHHSRP